MDKIQQLILDKIDAEREAIIAFGKSIKGEIGFCENDTSQKFKSALEGIGLKTENNIAVTGVRATLNGNANADHCPNITIIGELDGILCPEHPLANPENGVAHACGHSAQLAAVYGAAMALSVPQVADRLFGSVGFFAVPAEEYLSDKQRTVAGKLGVKYCCGKSELIRIGAFDDTDIALVSHAHMVESSADILLGLNAACGFISKTVIMHGKSAHAAAAPWLGVNALSAATLALNAVGLLREGFKDSDCIRIHTNITNGGSAVNVVPDMVVIEAMIRGKSLSAIKDAAQKFDCAMRYSAMAIGAQAEIIDRQGYMPLGACLPSDAAKAAVGAISGIRIEEIDESVINFASTDVGDLSQIMPVIGFTHGGVEGALHSAEFKIINDETAYILPAKLFALEAYELLKNSAYMAKNMLAQHKPIFTKQQYIAAVEGEEYG
ncbi:MAG: M20/M25/M40 family metallo-hydrolase [Oscillospiraceae bacterium]